MPKLGRISNISIKKKSVLSLAGNQIFLALFKISSKFITYCNYAH